MFKFHILRSTRDIFGHIILICLPIVLISIFNLIYSGNMIETGAIIDSTGISTALTIGFALTFQIYGASLSFETIGQDFLSPMHDRLLATPSNPRNIVMSVLFSSIVVSFLQTLVIILFSIIILDVELKNLSAILLVLLISVIVNQLIGTIILFLTKKVRTATAFITLYGSIVPFITGLYFPLPNRPIFDLMRNYLTPMSLAQTAIFGIMDQNYRNVLIGTIPLILIMVILFMLIKPLSRKVIL